MLWIIPNPPALARALVGVACSHICLASVVIGLRIWVRRMTGAFGIDDWFMVAGFVSTYMRTFPLSGTWVSICNSEACMCAVHVH